jgi:hypothetical protein
MPCIQATSGGPGANRRPSTSGSLEAVGPEDGGAACPASVPAGHAMHTRQAGDARADHDDTALRRAMYMPGTP